jgi:hypothetical protein
LTGHDGQFQNGAMKETVVSVSEFKAKCLGLLNEIAAREKRSP